jgi:hypothetical protein
MPIFDKNQIGPAFYAEAAGLARPFYVDMYPYLLHAVCGAVVADAKIRRVVQ